MTEFLYLTHPQVRIDPSVPVPDWGLSELGRARVEAAIARNAFAGVTHVVSSAERKAIDTAEPIASALGLAVEVRKEMHENDRSATGFLPGPEFEDVANAFFASPNESIRGWEKAIDAQSRIVSQVRSVMQANEGSVLCVGHGGVGTLLMCHFAGVSISRRYDQGPGGGGNVFRYRVDGPTLQPGWTQMEDWPPTA